MTPQHLVQEVSQLFTLPDIAVRVNTLIATPDSSSQELVEVVQLDPGLVAALLKLANSAYYGLSARVDSLSRAVAVIGERELQAMAMATSVTRAFKGLPEDLVDMTSFWDNSVSCGVIARLLGQRCRLRQLEQLFLAGLLHAVGRLVFYARQADAYRVLLATEKPTDDLALAVAERRVFGFDYATLGAALLGAWNLPVVLQELVACQVRPADAAAFPREAALLHVADRLASTVSPTLKGAATSEPGIVERGDCDPVAWASLGLDDKAVAEVLVESRLQALEILAIIDPAASVIY